VLHVDRSWFICFVPLIRVVVACGVLGITIRMSDPRHPLRRLVQFDVLCCVGRGCVRCMCVV